MCVCVCECGCASVDVCVCVYRLCSRGARSGGALSAAYSATSHTTTVVETSSSQTRIVRGLSGRAVALQGSLVDLRSVALTLGVLPRSVVVGGGWLRGVLA